MAVRRLVPACILVGAWACAFVGALFGDASVARAATAQRWSASTGAALATGTLEGTSIDSEGRLALAPEVRTLWGPDEGIVWSVAVDGDAAFVGLSGPGRLLRVRQDGGGKGGEQTETLLDVGADSLITAVTVAPRRGAFAGRSPEGEVLHVTKPGEVKSRGTTDALFVWALTTDEDGELWVGTGVPGRVLRNPDVGVMVEALETGEDPVRSLTAFPGGGVVAGTGGRGRVIRIDARNRSFVLYDAEEEEIVAVAAAPDGTVFALAAGGPKQIRGGPTAAVPRSEDNSATVTATPPPGDTGLPAGKVAESKPEGETAVSGVAGGALYRIRPDGSVRRLWHTQTELPFDLALLPGGDVIIATGDQGRIHRVDSEGRRSRVTRVAANQASAMAVAADGRVFVGGSTDARLETIDPRPRGIGTYSSAPIDAGSVAEWGRLEWEATTPAGAAIAFDVRAGNTDDPDESWTEWTPLDGSGVAVLPATRWSQVRAELRSGDDEGGGLPVLQEIALHYLPRNRPPVVEELRVGAAGVVWSLGPQPTSVGRGPIVADDPVARSAAKSLTNNRRTPRPIRRSYEHGARTFAWRAVDPDSDRLTFSLEIRRATDERWLPLASDIGAPFYSWDARAMPDGAYRTRLIASDWQDNPDGKALEHQSVSEVFYLDNTRPRVEAWETDNGTLTFDAVDDGGRIAAVELAWDGGAWEPIEPVDGVTDSERETYRVPVAAGRAAVMVRVIDAVGNVGGEARPVGSD